MLCSPQTEALRHGIVHLSTGTTLGPRTLFSSFGYVKSSTKSCVALGVLLDVPSLAKLQCICVAIWAKILVPLLMSH